MKDLTKIMTSSTNAFDTQDAVAAAKIGDRDAFERLVRFWHPRMVAHAWRLLGDSEQARDAAQDAWVEIARGLHRLSDDRAFPAWAFRIVTRRCSRIVAKFVTDRSLHKKISIQPLEPVGGEEQLNLSELGALQHAIRALPPDQRATIALHYFEHMSVAEIAVSLNVPAGTIKTRLMHARQKLRITLEGEKS